MLSGVCIGTNNLAAAEQFYDAVLATIGMSRRMSEEHEKGYADASGKLTVFVVVPFNEQNATAGNGTQIMFYAPNKDGVKAFHAAALQSGGIDEGSPGPRDYHPEYYGAYVRDLDGNKLNVSVEIT